VGLAGGCFEQGQLGEAQLAASRTAQGRDRLDHALVNVRHMLDAWLVMGLVMHAGATQARVGLTERVGLIERVGLDERSWGEPGAGTGYRARGKCRRRRGEVRPSSARLC